VLQAYGAAGIKIPRRVQSLMQDLDNLAAHANTVAQMDDRVRLEAIGRGIKSFDSLVIQEQEQALLSEITGLTNNVTSLKDQIALQKDRAELDEQLIDNAESSLDLEGKQISRQLQNYTDEQLDHFINNENTSGLPVGFIVNENRRRAKEEAELIKIQNTNTGVNTAARSSILGQLGDSAIVEISRQLEEQNQSGVVIPSVEVQGIDTKFTLNDVRKEVKVRAEQQQEATDLGINSVGRASRQNVINKNRTNAAGVSIKLNSLENSIPSVVNIPEFDALVNKIEQQAETGQFDISESNAKEIDTLFETVESKSLDLLNSDAEKQSVESIINFGRIIDRDAAANSFVGKTVERVINDAQEGSFRNGGLYSDLNNTWLALHNANVKRASDNEISFVQDLRSRGQKETSQPFTSRQTTLEDETSRAIANEHFRRNYRELLFVNKSKLIIADMVNTIQNNQPSGDNNVARTPEEMANLIGIVDELNNNLFAGSPDATEFSNIENRNNVTAIPLTGIFADEEGNNQEVTLTNPNTNEPILVRDVNVRGILDTLFSFEERLREAGFDYDLTQEFNFGFTAETVQQTVPIAVPQNGSQHELLALTNKTFMENKTATPEDLLANEARAVFHSWAQNRTFNVNHIEETQRFLSEAQGISDEFSGRSLRNIRSEDGKKAVRVNNLREQAIERLVTERSLTGARTVRRGSRSGAAVADSDNTTRESLQNMSITDLFNQGLIAPSQLIDALTESN